MATVREVAFRMAEDGEIVVRQKGAVVNGREAKGPIRLGRGLVSTEGDLWGRSQPAQGCRHAFADPRKAPLDLTGEFLLREGRP